MSATPLVNWAYSDWRLQATPAEQLETLKRHMQEVSGFMLESQSKGRGLKLNQDYMAHLTAELRRLEGNASLRQLGANRFGVSAFSRGSGP